jgi:hypothetical protein
MAFELGTITIYDDATAVHQPDVLVSAKAVQLAATQGVLWNMMSAPGEAITGKNFEIYGRTITALNGTIGTGAGTGWVDGAATTSLPMATANTNKLIPGLILKVENEIVIVKSVNNSAYTIDVWSRGAAGTSGAAHVDTTAYTVLGYAAHDTDLKNLTGRAETTFKYTNYVNTYMDVIEYELTQQLIGRRGVVDNVQILKDEAMYRCAGLLARMALLGVKQAGAKATDPYSSAGLYAQLEDTSSATRPVNRYNAGSVAFSKSILDGALAQVFQTGNPDTILVSQKYKNILNGFNTAFIQTNRQDNVAGYSIAKYEYEGKQLNVVVDQDCADTKVAILTSSKCQKGWQEGDVLRFVDEPASSSREKKISLQGSIGFIIEGVGYDHCEIYNLV